MDIFEYQHKKHIEKESPLAAKVRPKTIEEFVGQEHIVGEGTLLRRAIQADKLTSIILYGPPGTGKTTLAKIIANTTKSNFVIINATTSGVKDIKNIAEEAKTSISISGKKTILFIDEIHRFNKAQQDLLLPFVEDGTVVLIGATTENPYFEVNKALISRSLMFTLEPLEKEDITKILKRAIETELSVHKLEATSEALDFLADIANGDARVALNALELGALTTLPSDCGTIKFDIDTAKECIQKRSINYDKNLDEHYNTISAFIKSMRGSDLDATLYYLARMLYGGEDIRFIARRIVICASEDVGNADPMALVVATSAATAADFIGLPEAKIILAQAATYIARAPKSNASLGIYAALDDVKNIKIKTIPSHLKDASYKGAKNFGHGIGYKYPHDYDGGQVAQQYLPDELVGRKYYNCKEEEGK